MEYEADDEGLKSDRNVRQCRRMETLRATSTNKDEIRVA